jgi:galacturan 1,4-alpha-galacturonidase
MSDLALQSHISGCVDLYDIDAAAASDNAIIGNRHNESPAARSTWCYRVAPSLEHALRGADFVVASILPGTLAQMSLQIDACERMGIYHSVGDTVGPAGLTRSLRTIHFYAHLARRIAELCPDAWVINYTNPMTVCVRTMSAAFDRIKLVGCCHEVFGTQNLIARAAQESLGIEAIDRHELSTAVTGINHFTWITAASWRHVDLMPMYMNFAQRYAETGFTFDGVPESWRSSCFSSASRVKFDLTLRHGAIAAAGDRHIAEFAPTPNLKDPSSVEQWKVRVGRCVVDRSIDDFHNASTRSIDPSGTRAAKTCATPVTVELNITLR